MKRLVADTGPLLHLHEAGALHLLPLIGEVFLPPLVANELRSFTPALPPKSAKVQNLSPADQQRAIEWQRAGLLHGIGKIFIMDVAEGSRARSNRVGKNLCTAIEFSSA